MDKRMKAFIRIDGSGRSVPNSLVLRKNKPKVGKWFEVVADECCSPTTTTTTTIACLTYSLVVPEGTIAFYYTDCEGNYQILEVSGSEWICAIPGTLSYRGDAIVTLVGEGCITTTTTTEEETTTTTTTEQPG